MNNSDANTFSEPITREKLQFKEKFYYSFAQLPSNFYIGVMGVIQAFYYSWMGLQAFWIIIAQIIYALWNVINDPIAGVIEDRTRTKNGRYMPYIKYGAPLFSLGFALIFFPPGIWRGKQSLDIQIWLFVWYLVTQLFYDTIFTIVLIAHVALLPQMTLNQKDRTQVQLMCTLAAVPAFLLAFLLPVIYLAYPTQESVSAFQFLVICFSIFGVFPYWLLTHYVKEHYEFIPKEKSSFKESMNIIFKNKSFLVYIVYDAVAVFIENILIITLPFYIAWVLRLDPISMILFLIAPFICLGLSFKIVSYLAEKVSIKTALSYFLFITFIGLLITFFAGLTGNVIFICIGWSIFMLGFSADFMLHNVMRADTIDWDEFTTGERREAVYAGWGALFSKPMISVALALPTAIMTFYGLIYVESTGGLVATQGLEKASLAINISFALIPAIVALIGFFIWVLFYPLNAEVVKSMKHELIKIHQQKKIR